LGYEYDTAMLTVAHVVDRMVWIFISSEHRRHSGDILPGGAVSDVHPLTARSIRSSFTAPGQSRPS
jgi:hypothetical protein